MAGLSSDCSPEVAPQIWLAFQPESVSDSLPEWLTDSEREIVARFGGRRRREYLHSRWLIRQALAASAGCPTDDCYPVAGRPVASARPPGWQLSLSHSHGLSAVATTRQPGLGLDLEPLARRPDWQRVVRRWFTPREQAWLLARNDPEAFLRVWTLKEAWLKATRRGIANHLQTLEVDEDFNLQGDDPATDWCAAVGHGGDFLVTLVYHSAAGDSPRARALMTPVATLDLADARPAPGIAVHWLLQRRIRPADRGHPPRGSKQS